MILYSCTIVDRVDRALGFFPSSLNWNSPNPHPQASVSPTFGSGGGTHSLAGEGLGSPNSDEGTDTVVLKVHMYFVV